uniref:NADH-ubiquinone oxidoreductase chain 2 n=2 Tax=Nesidiocoris tenuis TaxID=355587 RepID=A0A059P667_9HEMI|nr:NADH dehydrogenase subunit 2 [Nesidiocoris tenuis]AFI54851.1 NADH dehydrogenase subunit 2 [Nesidiocoris tenuis]
MKLSTKTLTYMFLIMSTMAFEMKNHKLSQSCMMYFLIQSMGSIIFLCMILMKKYTEIMESNMIYSMIMMSMAIKLGLPPFHMWMPQMMEKIKWNMCMMLMTWQKLAPMYIMSLVSQEKLTQILVVISMATGSIMAINQTSLRKIMAYSTMTHMSWMILSMKVSDKMWMSYFVMYSILVLMTTIYFKKMNIIFISQTSVSSLKLIEKINFVMIMLSMGGLPPFLGFIPKWMIINEMIQSKDMFLMTFMFVMNLITLFYYIRVCMNVNMFLSQTQKWVNYKNTYLSKYMIITNMILAPIILTMSFF